MPGPTLDDLEGVRSPEKPTFGSHLVQTCTQLRMESLDEFTTEDLRIMIGQNIGLPHLLPRAVAVLEADPLAEGDYHPGDLLNAVLHCDRRVLRQQRDLLRRMVAVARGAEMLLRADASDTRSIEAKLLRDVSQFSDEEA
jgi:hypothetical protein